MARYASKYVSVRVDNEHVKLRSWEHAVDSLRGAQASGAPYWCSLLERVRHPAWWPEDREKHVPNYDQVHRRSPNPVTLHHLCVLLGGACALGHNGRVQAPLRATAPICTLGRRSAARNGVAR
jgi:hypothetical protein